MLPRTWACWELQINQAKGFCTVPYSSQMTVITSLMCFHPHGYRNVLRRNFSLHLRSPGTDAVVFSLLAPYPLVPLR